jgi:hypothetical protein
MPVPKSKITSYHYRRGGDREDLLMMRAITKFQQEPEHANDEEVSATVTEARKYNTSTTRVKSKLRAKGSPI